MAVELRVNGAAVAVESDPDTPLLYVLRDELGLTGTKYGCGAGSCGACVVLVNGEPVPSCDLPLAAVGGRAIRTIEGLAEPDGLDPLQQAFLDEQAGQCGYCLSGILMTSRALLDADPSPNEDAIRAVLDRHLCRCGAQGRVVRAVARAALSVREGGAARANASVASTATHGRPG
jgi:nicotinate dehydrogenase subunit A